MLLRQQGRCAYSGVVLSLRPHTDWRCSFERLDPSMGYTYDNVCLIASEFQTPSQWSKHKVLSLPELSKKRYCTAALQDFGQESKRMLKFRLRRLLYNARISSSKRLQRGRIKAAEFKLCLDDLLQLYVAQGGRCAYFRIPMTIVDGSEWTPSLERWDNACGYTVDNVGLICREFQSSDFSQLANAHRVTGSSQWSKEKADQMHT